MIDNRNEIRYSRRVKPETLRRWRLLLNMSQSELAKEFKIDRMTILRYENGKSKIPHSVELVMRQLLDERGINTQIR
jgi:transcriptional regulator with XRE-family HTH domain